MDSEQKLYPNFDEKLWTRSCEVETTEPVKGKITGTIPVWLSGSLLRNGPGSFKVGDYEYKHFFDGSALVQRFCIKNGEVTYQNRFVKSNTFLRNQAAKRIVFNEFGTTSVPDPCQTIFQRISAMFSSEEQTDNTGVSIYPLHDELFTFTETSVIHRINPETLDTEERIDVGKFLAVVNHSAHPHVLSNGNYYNIGLSRGSGLKYCIMEFQPSESKDKKASFEQARIVASIPVRWKYNPAYMHSFGITESYFVLIEQPFCINIPTMFKNSIFKLPYISSLKWYKDEPMLIHLIDRKTGNLFKTFTTDTLFFFHTINQYEEEGKVVLDVCCYDDASIVEGLYMDNLRNAQKIPDYAQILRTKPMRFVLPVSDSTTNEEGQTANQTNNEDNVVKPEALCSTGCELPRINYPEYLGKSYRYFYGVSLDIDSEKYGSVIKVDVSNKSETSWWEKGTFPNEPIFVASPNAKDEDDGVVLATILKSDDETMVGLVVLDARTMKEIGRATFQASSCVPRCLHGWFAGNSS